MSFPTLRPSLELFSQLRSWAANYVQRQNPHPEGVPEEQRPRVYVEDVYVEIQEEGLREVALIVPPPRHHEDFFLGLISTLSSGGLTLNLVMDPTVSPLVISFGITLAGVVIIGGMLSVSERRFAPLLLAVSGPIGLIAYCAGWCSPRR